MKRQDAFSTFIDEFKSVSPSITEEQRKGLLRRGIEEHGLSVHDAVEILNASGLVIGNQINYFEVLNLSVSEFEKQSESDFISQVEASHTKLYRESLKAGGRVRPDDRTEEQWREILNQARGTLTDVQKRHSHITMLEDGVFPFSETVSDREISIQETTSLHLTKANSQETSHFPSEQDGMVLIPAGPFEMGSDDYDANDDEKPIHSVYIDSFYMDKYPVTNAQFMEFMIANPQWQIPLWLKSHFFQKYHDKDYLRDWHKGNYPRMKVDHPVNWVSWYAAMAYAEWVGKRLPTEAEWEKAARGGVTRQKYLWGNKINVHKANFNKRIGETTPIDMHPPNGFGLYDMVGNVSEWCLDKWDSAFFKYSDKYNPVSGGSINSIIESFRKTEGSRVIRGGSWYSPTHEIRNSYRSRAIPWKTESTIGFRCVKSV